MLTPAPFKAGLALPANPVKRWRLSLMAVVFGFLLLFPFLPTPIGRSGTFSVPMDYSNFNAALAIGVSWAILTLLAVGIAKGWARRPATPFLKVAAAWAAIKVLSSLTGLMPAYSWWSGFHVWSDTVFFSGILLLFLYAILSLALSPKEIKAILWLFAVQIFLISAYVVFVFLRDTHGHPISLWIRPITLMHSPDFYLSYLFMLAPLLAALFLDRSLAAWQRRALAAGMVVIIAAGIVCLPLKVSQRGETLPAVPTGADAAEAFLANESNSRRFSMWEIGFALAKNHPALGVGPASLVPAYQSLLPTLPTWDRSYYIDHPHNELLEIAATEGLPGALAYAAFWLFPLAWAAKRWKNLEASRKVLVAPLALGLILFLGFNQLLFSVVSTSLYSWTWLALLLASLEEGKPAPYKNQGRALATLTAAFLFLGLGTVTANALIRADTTNKLAGAANKAHNFRAAVDLSKKAIALYPNEALYHNEAARNLAALATSGAVSPEEGSALVTQAVSQAQESIRLYPYSPAYLLDAGSLAFSFSQPGSPEEAEAIATLKSALAADPWSRAAYTRIGRLYAAKKLTADTAIKEYSSLIPPSFRAPAEALLKAGN